MLKLVSVRRNFANRRQRVSYGLRPRLRLVPDPFEATECESPDQKTAEHLSQAVMSKTAAVGGFIVCNTCSRYFQPRNRKVRCCLVCECYWVIVELVTMGRVNLQRAVPWRPLETLYRRRRRRHAHR